MTEFLPWAMVAFSFVFVVWQSMRASELADELRLTMSHASQTQVSYERQRKVSGVLLDVAREHKKKRDMYRHQLREANRKIRFLQAELNESIRMNPTPTEAGQQLTIPMSPLAAPQTLQERLAARKGLKVEAKIGG